MNKLMALSDYICLFETSCLARYLARGPAAGTSLAVMLGTSLAVHSEKLGRLEKKSGCKLYCTNFIEMDPVRVQITSMETFLHLSYLYNLIRL